MELAGSAATVVQLVDFAGMLIKTTTSFFAAVAKASKDLEILHQRIRHLEKLFENTRAIACSYQNSKLGLAPQNQHTLDLLGQALTVCSIDLQRLNDVLQKPLAQTDWRIVRVKRRVQHVFDEGTIRHLSLRLEGDINLISGLLSGINMYNDLVIQGSIERVEDLMEHLPHVSAKLATFSSRQQEANIIVDRLEKILERLNPVDKELAKGQEAEDLEPVGVGLNPLGRSRQIEVAAVRTDALLPALELFTPAFRTGLQFLYEDKGVHVSREAVCWLSSEFYKLLGEIHLAAARSHVHFLTDERQPDANFDDALMPRRFHRQTDIPKFCVKAANGKQLSVLPKVVEPLPCNHADILCDGTVSTTGGKLYAYFEGNHWSREWPFGNSESGRVMMCFVPKHELGLPGIGVSFLKHREYSPGCHHTFLNTFNILLANAPIIQAIKDGDRGVSRVLQKLKAGEAWAGDRDENGRSLLSHAVESGSRDMCALLFHMGAHPQDAYSMKQLQFSPVQQQHHRLLWSDR